MYLTLKKRIYFQQWKFIFFTVVHMYMLNQFWVSDAYLAPTSLKLTIVFDRLAQINSSVNSLQSLNWLLLSVSRGSELCGIIPALPADSVCVSFSPLWSSCLVSPAVGELVLKPSLLFLPCSCDSKFNLNSYATVSLHTYFSWNFFSPCSFRWQFTCYFFWLAS